jgi:hypothetical protein
MMQQQLQTLAAVPVASPGAQLCEPPFAHAVNRTSWHSDWALVVLILLFLLQLD